MQQIQPPLTPAGWVYFADTLDGFLALLGLVLVGLMIIWWRQQTRHWLRVVLATLLAAMILCTASYYLFVVPPYLAGCSTGCTGQRGFPLPVAVITLDSHTLIAPLDFAYNLLFLWVLWLSASIVWSLLFFIVRFRERPLRFQIGFVFLVTILPWAILPRLLPPPQPAFTGEDLRIANNSRRAAEFTYRITGFWVLQLAVEDTRRPRIVDVVPIIPTSTGDTSTGDTSTTTPATPATPATSALNGPTRPTPNQACLIGYTYFFIPWQRYRVELDENGIAPLSLTKLPLSQPCWEIPLP